MMIKAVRIQWNLVMCTPGDHHIKRNFTLSVATFLGVIMPRDLKVVT